MDLILRNARIAGAAAPGLVDIGVENGRIAAVAPNLAAEGGIYDAAGRLVCAGFVETHIHLDKSRIIDRCAPEQGRDAQPVPRVAAVKHTFTVEDVYQRARKTLESAISHGTTRMRTHVEVDPGVGLRGFEGVQKLIYEYRWAIDLEIAGPVELRLWIASDAPDADVHAKLVDVHPPNQDYPHGFAMNLCEGLLRLRYRESWEAPRLMTPGEVYAVTIELFPTANLFRRGHRLRLDIAGSNFPHFDVNPNSGEPEGSAAHPRRATTQVFTDGTRPSHLVLPVIPPSR